MRRPDGLGHREDQEGPVESSLCQVLAGLVERREHQNVLERARPKLLRGFSSQYRPASVRKPESLVSAATRWARQSSSDSGAPLPAARAGVTEAPRSAATSVATVMEDRRRVFMGA